MAIRKPFITFAFLLVIIYHGIAQTPATISASNFLTLVGSWEGSLTYLDYSTNKPYSMPANIDIKQIGTSNKFIFANSFPNETNANWVDTVTISENGALLNDEKVKSKKLLENGNLEIITEVRGIDGNDKKPAVLKYTYTIGKTIYIHRKDVQFEGHTEWINRHEYNYKIKKLTL